MKQETKVSDDKSVDAVDVIEMRDDSREILQTEEIIDTKQDEPSREDGISLKVDSI